MNILFIVPYVPNLIRVRPYNFICYLAKRGHRVTVATLWTNERDLEDIERLRGEGVRVEAAPLPLWRSLANGLQALPSRTPLQARYCWQPDFAEMLNGMFANANGRFPFDVIHVEHLRGVCFGLHLKEFLANNFGSRRPPLVWDSVDCISFLFRQASNQSNSLKGRLMTQIDLKRTEEYEAWLANQFDRLLLTSPHDRDAYLALASPEMTLEVASKIKIVPNGVDLDYFCPEPTVPRDPATLVVSGKMSYHANETMVIHLVKDVMPLVWEVQPDIRLEIVGKDPGRNILALAQEYSQIVVTGTVDDIRPYLRRATAAVSPVAYGAGIQNKVLEAMACGTPVVATPQAVSALTAVSGQDVLVGDTPTQLSTLILQIIKDKQQNRMIGENGYSYVAKHHDWAKIVARLEDCYQVLNDR